MNQFVVSQWFKYKKDLESYYENLIDALEQDKEGNVILFDPNEEEYSCEEEGAEGKMEEEGWHSTVMAMCEDVIKSLLDHVINKGPNQLGLKLVDTTYKHIVGGCYDVFYALRDKAGMPWVIAAFFGTYDSWMKLEKITKQKMKILLMHLSLLMVQRLRKLNERIFGTQIVLSKSVCSCAVHHLIDLQGLETMDYSTRYCISGTLAEMPRKSVRTLFRLLSERQMRHISLCLDAVAEDDDDWQEGAGSGQYRGGNTQLIGRRLAEMLVDRLIRFKLRGYLAICSIEPSGTGELHYQKDAAYEKMMEYDSKFVGDSYFIAVGETLNDLMNEIDDKVHQSFN